MKVGDLIILLIPASCTCILLLLTFNLIMESQEVWKFFILFLFFGNTVDTFSYLLSHLFSDPVTSTKFISLIIMISLIFVPLAFIVGGGASGGVDFKDGISTFFFISPLFTFGMTSFNLCCRGV